MQMLFVLPKINKNILDNFFRKNGIVHIKIDEIAQIRIILFKKIPEGISISFDHFLNDE